MDKQLVSEIEKVRQKLITVANDQPLFSSEVVEQSHTLDQLIAAYYSTRSGIEK